MASIQIDSIEGNAHIPALHKHNTLVHAAFAWDEERRSESGI